MELVYCNVRLLRDHGAERKASNDVEHAKKTIDKLQQQVSQIEVGCGFSKSERDSNFSVTEDDLQSKLARMQEMFSSTRSVSIFGLRGDQADDPDLYPIRLSGAVEYIESKNMGSLNMVIKSQEIRLRAWVLIQLIRPPLEIPPKPIACFYVRFSAMAKSAPPQDYYRAVYLSERTVRGLKIQISAKQIDPILLVRMMRCMSKKMACASWSTTTWSASFQKVKTWLPIFLKHVVQLAILPWRLN
ncbi:hypothetical protein N7541_000624 [Penicillium brevicompactum]|uniref:Grh/CP2 DB domain-containing protein n=1 Tax=Penicillium brevicompactum TaxID=5074 RepID=A0A9W9V2R0_PENBR|nr:hypothetical protein N7541_000624 [Penicillium brevicompactum]